VLILLHNNNEEYFKPHKKDT